MTVHARRDQRGIMDEFRVGASLQESRSHLHDRLLGKDAIGLGVIPKVRNSRPSAVVAHRLDESVRVFVAIEQCEAPETLTTILRPGTLRALNATTAPPPPDTP